MHCKTCNKTKFKSRQALMEHQKHCKGHKKNVVRGYRSGRHSQSVVNTGIIKTGKIGRSVDNRPYVLSGYDYIGKVTAQKAPANVADHVLFEQSIAPHAFNGTRIKQVSNLFEYINYLNCEMVYVPNVPKTIGGQLIGYYDLDPKDDPKTIADHDALVRSCMAHTGAQQFNLNNSVCIKMPKRGDSQKYYTGPTSTNTRFDTPAVFRIVQVTDPMSMDGTAIGSTTIDGGAIYLRWTAKFTVPQLEVESASSARSVPSQDDLFNESSFEVSGGTTGTPHVQHFTLTEPAVLYVNHVDKDIESTTNFSVALANHDGSVITGSIHPYEHIFGKSNVYKSVPKALDPGEYQVIVNQVGGPANICSFWLYAKAANSGVFATPWVRQPIDHGVERVKAAAVSVDDFITKTAKRPSSLHVNVDDDVADLTQLDDFPEDCPPATRDGSAEPRSHFNSNGDLYMMIPREADTSQTLSVMKERLEQIADQEREEFYRNSFGEVDIGLGTDLRLDEPLVKKSQKTLAEAAKPDPPPFTFQNKDGTESLGQMCKDFEEVLSLTDDQADVRIGFACTDPEGAEKIKEILRDAPRTTMAKTGDHRLNVDAQWTPQELADRLKQFSKVKGVSFHL